MLEIKKNINLGSYNTFGIPAIASAMVVLNSEEDLEFLPSIVKEYQKVQIIGEGSNILFSQDYDGLIILNRIPGINFETSGNEVTVTAGGGVIWDNLVEKCCQLNYNGIENLSLIPGTVGAAPVQNIGAYGVELNDLMVSCDTFNISTGEKKSFIREKCDFSYRNSIFKKKNKNRLLITSVVLRLTTEKRFTLSYRALSEKFSGEDNTKLSADVIRDAVINIRESKLPDPKELGNAGSFFKNPEITKSKFIRLQKKHGKLTFFKIGDKYKIPAAWLIEQSGLKGLREGNTGTYKNQPLVIVNYGVDSGEELVKFSKKIEDKVYDRFGIKLEPEVNII